MNIYEEAKVCMEELRSQTKEMGTGVMPNPMKILEIQGQLCEIHMNLASDRSDQFGKWQAAELERKRTEASKFKAQRAKADKPSVKDAEKTAFILSLEEYTREEDAEELYKKMIAFSASIEHAIDFARSVQSFMKNKEGA